MFESEAEEIIFKALKLLDVAATDKEVKKAAALIAKEDLEPLFESGRESGREDKPSWLNC